MMAGTGRPGICSEKRAAASAISFSPNSAPRSPRHNHSSFAVRAMRAVSAHRPVRERAVVVPRRPGRGIGAERDGRAAERRWEQIPNLPGSGHHGRAGTRAHQMSTRPPRAPKSVICTIAWHAAARGLSFLMRPRSARARSKAAAVAGVFKMKGKRRFASDLKIAGNPRSKAILDRKRSYVLTGRITTQPSHPGRPGRVTGGPRDLLGGSLHHREFINLEPRLALHPFDLDRRAMTPCGRT